MATELDEWEGAPDDLCDEPCQIVVHQGAVVMFGPINGAVALTREAAIISAKRLLAAAIEP